MHEGDRRERLLAGEPRAMRGGERARVPEPEMAASGLPGKRTLTESLPPLLVDLEQSFIEALADARQYLPVLQLANREVDHALSSRAAGAIRRAHRVAAESIAAAREERGDVADLEVRFERARDEVRGELAIAFTPSRAALRRSASREARDREVAAWRAARGAPPLEIGGQRSGDAPAPQDRADHGARFVSLFASPGSAGGASAPAQRKPGGPDPADSDHFRQIADFWSAEWKTRDPGPARAEGRRTHLLLSMRQLPDFASSSQVDVFVDQCLKLASSERQTWTALVAVGASDDEFIDEGEAFPSLWADRIYRELHGVADERALLATANAAKLAALGLTAGISDEIWSRGLPLPLAHAARLQRGGIPELALDHERARQHPKEAIGGFALALTKWARADSHHRLVHNYEYQLGVHVGQIRDGRLAIDRTAYEELTSTKLFHTKLRVFENAASSPDDMRKAFTALLVHTPTKFFRSGLGGGLKYEWPNEGLLALWTEVQEVDARISATSYSARVWRSLVWASERGYFGAAGIEVYEALKDNWLQMLAMATAILFAQKVPGVNIAVDVVLLIEFGVDAIQSLFDLKDALDTSGNAQSVEAMQRASAKMARTLFGKTAELLLWAATYGIAKVGKKFSKWRDGKDFLDEHGNSPEARDALAKSKGDVKQARELLARQREERLARERAATERKQREEAKQQEEAKRQNEAKRQDEAKQQEEAKRQDEAKRQNEAKEQDDAKREAAKKKDETSIDDPGKKPSTSAPPKTPKSERVPPPKDADGNYDFTGREGKALADDCDDGLYAGESSATAAARAKAARQEVVNRLEGLQPCFVAGTPVLTADGPIPIEEIDVGMSVLARDPLQSDSFRSYAVVATYRGVTDMLRHVTIGRQTITATLNHRFYVEDRGWTEARALSAGDILITARGGHVPIDTIAEERLRHDVVTYNLQVVGVHTYFVGGTTPVLVHNNNPNWGRPLWWMLDSKAKFRATDRDGVSFWRTNTEQDVMDLFKIRKSIDQRSSSDAHRAFTTEELASKGIKVEITPGNGALAGRLSHGSARPSESVAGDLKEAQIQDTVNRINQATPSEKAMPKTMGCK